MLQVVEVASKNVLSNAFRPRLPARRLPSLRPSELVPGRAQAQVASPGVDSPVQTLTRRWRNFCIISGWSVSGRRLILLTQPSPSPLPLWSEPLSNRSLADALERFRLEFKNLSNSARRSREN